MVDDSILRSFLRPEAFEAGTQDPPAAALTPETLHAAMGRYREQADRRARREIERWEGFMSSFEPNLDTSPVLSQEEIDFVHAYAALFAGGEPQNPFFVRRLNHRLDQIRLRHNAHMRLRSLVAPPECDGMCVTAGDIGLGPADGVDYRDIAYPHPGCPLHDPEQACGCGQPDRCMSPTHGRISLSEALQVRHRQDGRWR